MSQDRNLKGNSAVSLLIDTREQEAFRLGLDIRMGLLPEGPGEAGQVDVILIVKFRAAIPGFFDQAGGGIKGGGESVGEGIELCHHLADSIHKEYGYTILESLEGADTNHGKNGMDISKYFEGEQFGKQI